MKVDLLETMQKIAGCRNIRLTVMKEGKTDPPDFDMGIRHTLLEPGGTKNLAASLYEEARERTVYFVRDFFEAEYCVIRVPESERSYGDFLFLGPYRDSVMTNGQIAEMMEEKSIPREYVNELREYYNALPVVSDIGQWRELCMSMAQTLYGEVPIQSVYMSQMTLENSFRQDSYKDELSFKMIEQRYAVEGELLKAISNGNLELAMTQLNRFSQYRTVSRYRDSSRDVKNMLLSFNTLFRKAAEAGGVHPAHVDEMAVQFSKRIEGSAVERSSWEFMVEMTRKYCMLVRDYSLRGHSPVIQKVVNHINLNLSRDLSLKHLSVEYSVNASYLSALFKKEMGTTLTDYISQQRIRHAITLLNSTSLQIQDIASETGIYDVNYFRKLFKKITGKTPTEYAREVRTGGMAVGAISMAR